MSLETIRTCPQCHRPLPAHTPEGLCPQCLMKAAGSLQSGPQGTGNTIDIGDPVAVGKCLPQFEVLELLGRGGMGVVYKARQRNLDRLVALKILPPADALATDFVERFTREARSLAKLSHPNIVTVYEFGESGGLYYFVMELVDGVNLREMIRTGKMKPEEALAVVPKICDALQFAHEEGVVHRDVKPENILVDKRGRVKIADFGLAKLLRREQADHTLTMTGMTLGTPRYMAPEQLDKPETVDHRADIYSLGVVFYEMLTGEIPMGRFAPPSEKVRIDVRLDEIVLHALEHDVERRYQHVSQVRDDVEKVTSKPQAAAPSPTPPAMQAPPVNHLNNLLGFFMTPQPGYARQVGIPMLIFTGAWMIATLVITFSVPQENQNVHLIAMLTGLVGIPLGLLVLSLRWAVRRGKTAEPAAGANHWNGISLRAAIVGVVLASLLALGFYVSDFAGFATKLNSRLARRTSEPAVSHGALPPGTRVAAWYNGLSPIFASFYIATTVGTDASGSYFVRYGDGDSGLVSPTGIVPVDAAREIPIGARVLARWKGAAMFPGLVTQRRENLYTVKWDDGDAPMDVPREEIAPLDKHSPAIPSSYPRKSEPKTKP